MSARMDGSESGENGCRGTDGTDFLNSVPVSVPLEKPITMGFYSTMEQTEQRKDKKSKKAI